MSSLNQNEIDAAFPLDQFVRDQLAEKMYDQVWDEMIYGSKKGKDEQPEATPVDSAPEAS